MLRVSAAGPPPSLLEAHDMREQEITDAIVARKDDNGAIAMILMAIMRNAGNMVDAETPSKRHRVFLKIEEATLLMLDFLPKEVRAQLSVICKARLQDFIDPK